MFIVMLIIYLAIVVGSGFGYWKVFEKMGQPGWVGIIPFYNWYVLAHLAGKPEWKILAMIPLVNIYFLVMIFMNNIAKAFGKTPGFGVGMAILPFAFLVMVGISDAKFSPPPGSVSPAPIKT